jgi:hypothetical protein
MLVFPGLIFLLSCLLSLVSCRLSLVSGLCSSYLLLSTCRMSFVEVGLQGSREAWQANGQFCSLLSALCSLLSALCSLLCALYSLISALCFSLLSGHSAKLSEASTLNILCLQDLQWEKSRVAVSFSWQRAKSAWSACPVLPLALRCPALPCLACLARLVCLAVAASVFLCVRLCIRCMRVCVLTIVHATS